MERYGDPTGAQEPAEKEVREPQDVLAEAPNRLGVGTDHTDEPGSEPRAERDEPKDRDERERLRAYLIQEYGANLDEDSGDSKATDPWRSSPAGEQVAPQEREGQPDQASIRQKVARADNLGRLSVVDQRDDARERVTQPEERPGPQAAGQFHEAQENVPQRQYVGDRPTDFAAELSQRNAQTDDQTLGWMEERKAADSGPIIEDSHEGTAYLETSKADPAGRANGFANITKMEAIAAEKSGAPQPSDAHQEGEKNLVEKQGGVNSVQIAKRILEPSNSLAIFEAAAQRLKDGRARFDIPRKAFEERTGFKFQEGPQYEIKGTLEGVGEVRKVLSAEKFQRLAFFVSREDASDVRRGEKHRLRVDSVKEISRTAEQLGVFPATAYPWNNGKDIRFDLRLHTFEKRTGVRFEQGKMYEVRGRLGDVCDFRLTRAAKKNEHVVVQAPREFASRFASGEKYDVKVTSVEEKRTLRIPHSESHIRMLVKIRALRVAGLDAHAVKKSEHRIVELHVRNLSQPDRGIQRFYTTLEPTRGSAVLHVGHGGWKQGDVYELVTARQPTIRDFVEDFNAHRGKQLENVLLGSAGEKLWMDIQGKKFEFTEHRMHAYDLRLIVDSKMDLFEKELRFVFDGKTITPRYGESPRIRSFSLTNAGMCITYKMGSRVITTHSDSAEFREGRLGRQHFLGKVEPVGTRVAERDHRMKIDDELFEKIQMRISDSFAKSHDMYFQEKGSIGENIVVADFMGLGWKEIAAHPMARGNPGPEPYKGGTDTLMSSPNGEKYLVECRWMKDVEAALTSACDDVMRRKAKEQANAKWGKIEGAYVAVVDLDLTSNTGQIRVRRVW